jgi:uncharacterized protein YbjT (DUF2867 family)/membrane protease YdiL (CAAX protease family)
VSQTGAIAVAGGSGFIGRHVVSRLLEAGWRVIVLARGRASLPLEIAGAELRRCDLAGEVDLAWLEGCGVLVNLVGIKRERPELSWEQAHVELPLRLAAAANAAGVEHMIHVTVAGSDRVEPDTAPSSYLGSKARGERALRALDRGSSPAITILRPNVVYGRGDDMLRNLADSIRAAPVFPAPRGGRAPIQAIAVEDVAEAVLRCVERSRARGCSYDLVGPERPSLREIVARVSAALERRCLVVPAPLFVQRPIAAVLEKISDDPLITRSQLDLLARGVVGDPEPARAELGLEPRVLDRAAIDRALAEFEPRLPSLRLVPDLAASGELAELGGVTRAPAWRVALFALLAPVALLLGPWLIASVWLRMAALELGLSLVAFACLGMSWAKLWRPSASALAWGVGAGLVTWAGAFAVAELLGAFAPGLWSRTSELYAWAGELPVVAALGLLTLIVAGEEIVWRGALGLGMAARVGAWPAVAISAGLFTLAHLTTGPLVLAIAAALAGAAWTWLAIRTRSLFASYVAHLGWDVAMLWLTPLS